MLGGGLRQLRRSREMDEPVAQIDGGADEFSLHLGGVPFGPVADLVDGRHGIPIRVGAPRPYRPLSLEAIIPIIGAGMGVAMLMHAQVWSAIDRLAARAGLSASGLSRRACLDPTTFNKSKRITPAGRARWPSTESIAKALAATGTTMETFVALTQNGDSAPPRGLPLLGFAEAGAGGYFDDGGFPAGTGWDEIAFPAVNDEHAYALAVSGQSMEPAYRNGDI